jgi:hypothetical protein
MFAWDRPLNNEQLFRNNLTVFFQILLRMKRTQFSKIHYVENHQLSNDPFFAENKTSTYIINYVFTIKLIY